jgi:HSP20 family protein
MNRAAMIAETTFATGASLPANGQPVCNAVKGEAMALMRFDPFRELDRMTEQALVGSRAPRTLPMEAFRRGDQFIVAIDVPGVDPSEIDVTVERNVVEVTARRRPLRQEGDELIIDERPSGEFRRQLFLGDNLDPNRLSAQTDRGVLVMNIPVSEESKPRKIPVGSANQGQQAIQTGTQAGTGTGAQAAAGSQQQQPAGATTSGTGQRANA